MFFNPAIDLEMQKLVDNFDQTHKEYLDALKRQEKYQDQYDKILARDAKNPPGRQREIDQYEHPSKQLDRIEKTVIKKIRILEAREKREREMAEKIKEAEKNGKPFSDERKKTISQLEKLTKEKENGEIEKIEFDAERRRDSNGKELTHETHEKGNKDLSYNQDKAAELLTREKEKKLEKLEKEEDATSNILRFDRTKALDDLKRLEKNKDIDFDR